MATVQAAIRAVLGDVDAFASRLIGHLSAAGVDVSRYEMDHVCYRVESNDEYLEKKKELNTIGQQLYGDAIIGGRPIATFKLNEPIRTNGKEVTCVELPSPKRGSPYKTGLEHAEFVIDESFEAFMARHPSLVFDLDAINKEINADVRLSFEDGAISAKFHHMPLEKVMDLENASPAS
eukprot:Opistho-2@493